jgi:predicted DNA binding protein
VFDSEVVLLEDYEGLSSYFKKKFLATYFYLIYRQKNEVTCIMNQKRSVPVGNLKDFVWAIISPVSIDKTSIVLSILISEQDMDLFLHFAAQNAEVLVLSNTKIEDFKSGFGYSGFSMPSFTKRQREIVMYAIKREFFDTPKKASGEEIADELGITYATFYEHVRKVERKLIKHAFG